MPCGQKAKTENRNNIVTNSIKTLKIVHIKKKKKLKKNNKRLSQDRPGRQWGSETGRLKQPRVVCPQQVAGVGGWDAASGGREDSIEHSLQVFTPKGQEQGIYPPAFPFIA